MATKKKTPAAGRKPSRGLTDKQKRRFRESGANDATRAEILRHAKEGMKKDPPEEVCGFIATDGKHQRAFRSPNLSSEPAGFFRTCPKAWRRVEDKGWEIIGIYHSHVNEPPTPSLGDKAQAESKKLPFVIVGMPTEVWGSYIPTGFEIPLIGRPFVYGALDCRILHRDYYKRVLGIHLPEFEYEDDWWEHGKDLFVKNYKKAGFVRVGDLRKHDTLFIQIPPSEVANHCAVYLGDGEIMHHLAGRISNREPYLLGHGYGRPGVLRMIVRHRSLC
jgi:proteasome lid subunit RPN8/RPN11